MTIIEYRRALLQTLIEADADQRAKLIRHTVGVEGTRMLLRTFEHDVVAAAGLYDLAGISATNSHTGIRIFREDGNEIYVRYEAGGPIFGRRISKQEMDRLDALAYEKKLRST